MLKKQKIMTSVKIEIELHQRLKDVSKKSKISMGQIIEQAITDKLDSYDGKNAIEKPIKIRLEKRRKNK